MPNVLVRDVPEDVHRTYRRRAAEAGQSLQEFLLAELVEGARTQTPAEVVAEVERQLERTAGSGFSPSSSTEFFRTDGRPVGAFDLDTMDAALAGFLPELAVRADIGETRGQVALFDELIVNDEKPKVVDVSAHAYEAFFTRLTSVDLLYIDDLGSERHTDWVVEQLYALVNERYENQRSMLVTSNAQRDVEEGRRQLEDQIGSRTVSRLVEICDDPLPLFGPDQRDQARAVSA